MKFYIKEARERIGLSQKQLAQELGIKPSTFNGYETGAHDPKSGLLAQIALRCNTTVDFLLGLEQNEQKNAPEAMSMATEAEMLQYFELLENILVNKGYIKKGEDISEQDADFLIALLDLIDAHFENRC